MSILAGRNTFILAGRKGGIGVQQGINLNVTIPDGYINPMVPDVEIKRIGGVATIQNYTIDDFRRVIETPIVKYLSKTGSDSNNGDTVETPYLTLNKLRLQTFDRAYITEGNYAADSPIIFGDNHEFIGSGDVYFARGFVDWVWTSLGDGVYSFSHHATPTNIIDTFIKDSNGDVIRLDLVGSVGEIVENSYYYDSVGDLVYIKLTASRVPDSYVTNTRSLITITAGKQIHLNNIQILGGIHLEEVNVTRNTFTAIDCKFLHMYSSSACRMNGNVDVWVERCVAARARDDAFSFHAASGRSPAAVGPGSIGRDTGGSENDGLLNSNNNAFTLHEAAVGLWLDCYADNTEGPLYHDSGQAESLYVDCAAGESSSILAANRTAFAVASVVGDTVKMWLDGVTGGSVTTFGAENRAPDNSTIYAKESNITNIEPGTVLVPY